jgi:hypothetical protein
VNAALINLMLITQGPGTGIYATLDFSRYPLLQSTLINNYGATHLVNSKDLLEPRSFVKASSNESVEAKSSALLIISRGTRVIKRALNGKFRRATINLILKNVAVIEGFHVNIISKARLLKSSV